METIFNVGPWAAARALVGLEAEQKELLADRQPRLTGARRGLFSGYNPRALKKAKKNKRESTCYIVQVPIGTALRSESKATQLNWGALPVQPWCKVAVMHEWDPSSLLVGYNQTAAGSDTVNYANATYDNWMPYADVYTGAIANPGYAIGGSATAATRRAPDKNTEINALRNLKRLNGVSPYVTLELKFRLIGSPETVTHERCRFLMIQVEEEVTPASGAKNVTQVSSFFEFFDNDTTYTHVGFLTPRCQVDLKEPDVENQNVKYRVLIDQQLDVTTNVNVLDYGEWIHMKQSLGPVELDDAKDPRSDLHSLRPGRAGRILWGIYQENSMPASGTGSGASQVQDVMHAVQFHGVWKVIIHDGGF